MFFGVYLKVQKKICIIAHMECKSHALYVCRIYLLNFVNFIAYRIDDIWFE